jgi:hypothetical protein
MRRGLLTIICAGALVLATSASASADGLGSIVMLRAAASTVITAELHHDGASACSKLYAPLTTTVEGKTCAERWDARSARLLGKPGGAARLRADLRALADAPVTLNGPYATIALPDPLLGGRTRFYWTADCWMLIGAAPRG